MTKPIKYDALSQIYIDIKTNGENLNDKKLYKAIKTSIETIYSVQLTDAEVYRIIRAIYIEMNRKNIGGCKRRKNGVYISNREISARAKIINLSKDFDGKLNDTELMKNIGISRNSLKKYKKNIRDIKNA